MMHGDQIPIDSIPSSEESAVSIDVENIPPLPEVAWKVLKLTSEDDCGIDEITKIISRDQSLTGSILRMANSPFFGLRRQVATITHAGVVLGVRRMRTLVIAVSMSGIYRRTPLGSLLWDHSLVVGLIASEISRLYRVADPELSLIAGLMHDVGKSVLDISFPDRYIDVVQMTSNGSQSTLEIERSLLGIDHTQVGAIASEAWDLPSDLRETILFHHAPEKAAHPRELACVTYLANGLAYHIGFGTNQREVLDIDDLVEKSTLDIEAGLLSAVSEDVGKRFQKEKDSFGF